jgi:hypothetical protein
MSGVFNLRTGRKVVQFHAIGNWTIEPADAGDDPWNIKRAQ